MVIGPVKLVRLMMTMSGCDKPATTLSDAGTVNGVSLWVYDKGTFTIQASNTAGVDGLNDLEWSSTDRSQLARLLAGSSPEVAFAVTPNGTNGSTSASVAIDYVEAIVRYRRP